MNVLISMVDGQADMDLVLAHFSICWLCNALAHCISRRKVAHLLPVFSLDNIEQIYAPVA